MGFYYLEFLIGQSSGFAKDIVGHTDLTAVMKKGHIVDAVKLLTLIPHFLRDHTRIFCNPV